MDRGGWSAGSVLRALAHPLLVLVVALVLTLGMTWRARTIEGVYWGQATVVFLAPKTTIDPNALTFTTAGSIATAGLVAIEVFQTTRPRVSGAKVRLYSMGHDSDVQVTQPNIGGQWATNFGEPILDVQVVAPTQGEARDTLDEQVAAILDRLDALQPEGEVPPGLRIRATVTPTNPSIRYVRGSPTRAMAGTMLVGILMSLGLAAVARRARHKAPATAREA